MGLSTRTCGTNRFDTHTGIQEAFVEAKIHDVSPNFDFVSLRVGIQSFSSDFRGFIFAAEEPGIRRIQRISGQIALTSPWLYFYLHGKDFSSGLNTFEARHQQVGVGNVYIQDFFAKVTGVQLSPVFTIWTELSTTRTAS